MGDGFLSLARKVQSGVEGVAKGRTTTGGHKKFLEHEPAAQREDWKKLLFRSPRDGGIKIRA